jgi:hypothetical protein
MPAIILEGGMKIKLKSQVRALLLGGVAASLVAIAGSADAAVTEYTSQSAFDAAAPAASTFGFNAGGVTSVEPNPATFGTLSFSDNVTADDTADGGIPLLFLVSATDTPTYGRDFLSYQNENLGISAEIDSAGATAIGFSYGSNVPAGDATLTLSTGDSFTITPSTTASFIGFTSTSPITSVSVDYPNSFAFDLISVSSLSAVPEPASWAMMLVGFGGLGAAMRSRRKLTATTA